MNLLFLFLISISSLFIACDKRISPSETPFCEFERVETYQLETNPNSDFDVNPVAFERQITTSTCPTLNKTLENGSVSRVKRQGNEIVITEAENEIFERMTPYEIEGSNIKERIDTGSTGNRCEFEIKWNGTINPANQTLQITSTHNYYGNCEFYFIK